MEYKRITSGADPLYEPALEIYRASFPLHEQRLPQSQARILSHPEYHFTCLVENEQLLGILLYWESDAFFYVEHFAIDPALRGQSCGSRALKGLLGGGKTVILEIDPPVTEIAVRRKGFYERLGFRENPYAHVHPPYREGYKGHDLMVLSCPQEISADAYAAFAAYLAQTVMGR